MSSSGYTPWSVTAGEMPTTAYWNILGANDASFNTGNGFNDGILLARHFSNLSVTTPAMSPTYAYYDGTTLNNGTGTRSTVSGSGGIPTGCSVNYTTGTTNEVVMIHIAALISSSAAGGVCGIQVAINGSKVGHRTYNQETTAGYWHTDTVTHLFVATANTTYSVGIYVLSDQGTATICNANTDYTAGYDPQISIVSFGSS